MKRSVFCSIFALVAAGFFGCSADARKDRALAQANSYFDAGEYDKAKIEYLNVLRADPQSITAVERLGTIWYQQGAPMHAVPFLLRARELNPSNLEARAKLGLILLSNGQFSDARQEAIAILNQSQDYDQAMLILAEASRNQRDIEDAERRLGSINAMNKVGFHLAWAALSLRKKDLASAERAVKDALSLNPSSPEAHVALGKIYWAQNDLVRAEDEFKSAARLAPPRSAERFAYAEFKTRTGRLAEARLLLNELTGEAPDFLPATRLLAQVALAERKFDEALTLADNVILRDPVNIEARLLQGQVLLAKGEVSKATESLVALDTSFPKVPAIKHQLARAYLEDGNVLQATTALNQAVVTNPDYLEAVLLLGEVNLRNGKFQEVVIAMRTLLERRPDVLPAQIILAQAYQSLGRLEEAKAIFKERTRVSPQNAQAHLLLGLILKQQDKPDEARKAFAEAQRLAPENLLAVAQLAALDIQTKNFDAALQRVNEQVQKTPQSPAAHFLRGQVYAAQAQWDLAETSLRKTLALDPESASAYDLLLSTFVASNQLPEAVKLLEEWLLKKPDSIRALMLLGQLYDRLNEFTKARDAYDRLLSIKADSPHAQNNLAVLYAERLGELEKAYALAQSARALLPEDPAIADTLGWVLYKRGNYQEALTMLTEAGRKLPDNAEVQFHLGMANYVMGKMDEARHAFADATASPGNFSGKDEARRRLSLLEANAGDTPKLASRDLEAILSEQPNDPLARTLLGESYERQGAFAEAAAAYEQAIKLNPQLLSATARLAELNAGPLNAAEKALDFAKKARELAPNDPKIIGILGDAAYQNGNFSWAYSLLQESARQLPNDSEVLYDLAWAAYSLGKLNEAQQWMQRVIAAAPNSNQTSEAELFLNMIALHQKGATSKAAQDEVEDVLRENPGYVPALLVRAALLESRGESEGAIKIYTEVLNRFPDFAPAQKNLALLYQQDSQKRDEAYDLAVKARQILSDDPELAQILAKLSYEKNEFAYAVHLFKQSAERKPLNAEDLYYLGMSQFKSKDIAQARDTLDQALAAGLDDPLASDAKRTIENLTRNN